MATVSKPKQEWTPLMDAFRLGTGPTRDLVQRVEELYETRFQSVAGLREFEREMAKLARTMGPTFSIPAALSELMREERRLSTMRRKHAEWLARGDKSDSAA